jgi:hypothetical protein
MRISKVRLLLAAIAASFLLAPSAEANNTAMKQRYSALYHAVKKRHGSRAPGRNIRKLGIRFDVNKDGKPGPWQTRPAKPSEIRASIRQLRVLLRPARSLLVRRAVPPGHPPAGVLSSIQRAPAGGTLAAIRQCESGGNYGTNTGNGFYGAYQFDLQTWRSVGGSGLPSNASPAEQDMRASMLHSQRGAAPWPVCGR